MHKFENIASRLRDNAAAVEGALDAYYSPTPDAEVSLVEAQRYGILGGGKRIRAFLTMECARLLGGTAEAAMPYACALEMIHASSLIHDDMECMDNDAMRRGKPAVHTKYGEGMALIAGDAMCVKAFEVAVANEYASPESNARAVAILASAAGERGMLAGQAVDLAAATTRLSLDEIRRLHSLKTGRLFRAAAALGCTAAGADATDARYASLTKYAENIGLAFQIVDDILDFESGERELNSFLSFTSLDEAKIYAASLASQAVEALCGIDDGTLAELADYLSVRKY